MRAGPVQTAVPAGTRIVLDRRTRTFDDGAVLLGGAPPRMLRLSPGARALLVDGTVTVRGATSAALARRLLDAGIAHPVAEPATAVPAPSEVTVVVPVKDRTEGLARLLTALTATAPTTAPPAVTATASPAGTATASPIDTATASPIDTATASPTVTAIASPTVTERITDRGDTAQGPGERRGLPGSGAAPEPPGLRVIVVDDGSADPAAVRAVAERAGAAVLRHPSSRGPAAARNAGLAAATTPFVVFLDSDVVPEPGWLAPLLARLADPAVGLVAPRIVALSPGGSWLARYEAVRSSLDLGPDAALVVPRSRVAYVPSAALLVRRAAVGAGFDDALRVAEDVDLVLRLHAAGWRMRYEPAARVAHDHRTTLAAWWLRKAFYGTGAAPLALRHPGAVPPIVLSPWSAAACALLLCGRPLAALAVTVGAARRLSTRLGMLRHPGRTAARLVALGLVGAVSQTADALTRHYWPLTAVAALASRRFRVTFGVIAVGGALLDWWRVAEPRPALPAFVLARRLDDLGYGAGLWWGAFTHRTSAPLRPAGPALRATPKE